MILYSFWEKLLDTILELRRTCVCIVINQISNHNEQALRHNTKYQQNCEEYYAHSYKQWSDTAFYSNLVFCLSKGEMTFIIL